MTQFPRIDITSERIGVTHNSNNDTDSIITISFFQSPSQVRLSDAAAKELYEALDFLYSKS